MCDEITFDNARNCTGLLTILQEEEEYKLKLQTEKENAIFFHKLLMDYVRKYLLAHDFVEIVFDSKSENKSLIKICFNYNVTKNTEKRTFQICRTHEIVDPSKFLRYDFELINDSKIVNSTDMSDYRVKKTKFYENSFKVASFSLTQMVTKKYFQYNDIADLLNKMITYIPLKQLYLENDSDNE